MEKKQLVIVPPMSESLQKLNEVLQAIANDENIEISIIDDMKELTQFMGSAGQSLVVFANAKKCATYLQENRFMIAKSHSKIILFTPKEIPNKTLIKFVKIGLTEAILENSPPKTLLYKVKLLLRSIKTAPLQDDKDLVVKSKQESGIVSEKTDQTIEKAETDETSVDYLAEERAKFKTTQDENAIDYGGSLKGKASQEEAIETHYKSKRKKDEIAPVDEIEDQKVGEEGSSEIDMYYRGKRKKENINQDEEEDLYGKKLIENEMPEESYGKKRKAETMLDLEPAEPEARKKLYQEEDDLFLNTKKDGLVLEAADEQPKPKKILTEEEKAENNRKELEELDALFEEAKKRQAAQQAEDLGGHLKGKILNNTEEDNDVPDIKEKKEYDNSELHAKEKSLDLDLIAAEKEKKRTGNNEEEEEEKAPHTGQVDKLNNNMLGENGSTDKINTNMVGELDGDTDKNRFEDEKERDSKKANLNIEEDAKDLKKKLELEDGDESARNSDKQNEKPTEENKKNKEELLNLQLEPEAAEEKKKKILDEAPEDENGVGRKSTTLQLLDGDEENTSAEKNEEDARLSLRKLDQTQLDLEKDKEGDRNHGKVDKIDTFYRGGNGIKTEHSWDNLDNKNRDINLQLEKAARNESGSAAREAAKDYGEITIDYRKLKEEFDQISRNGASSGESGISEERSQNLLDSEDAGTFKVIEFDPRGFDFGINIINLIYQKDSKAADIYKSVGEELITKYKAYSVFYTFKSSEQKHTEVFDSFMHFSTTLVSNELKEWWLEFKTQNETMNDYFSKTMTTWLCREIEDKSGVAGKYWEDVELPQWAANELTTKKVELVFPYYDGVDRMGVALVYLPEGLNPKIEKGLTVTLEMARTALLDSIQRISAPIDRDTAENTLVEKKKILSMFTGLFNRNKTG